MSGEPLVQVSGLHKRYGAVHAVRGLDLELGRGEVLGLLGANGAGKTTTMGMLAGVLAPSAGWVHIAGHDLLRHPLAAKARLGYLPESPPLFPELTVDEYLHHCARLRRVSRRGLAAAVSAARERCGLTQSGSRLLGNLSKGYRQRVGIAQAIVHQPDVVILDEPTSGLDPGQLRGIRALIRELGEHHAVIFSTHILPEVQSVCTRVHIIHDGVTALTAPMDQLPGDGGRYRVRLARPPTESAIAALAVVSAVSASQDGALSVTIADDDAAVARFSAACAEQGWGLLELTPTRRSLEDLFMSVCYADPASRNDDGAAS